MNRLGKVSLILSLVCFLVTLGFKTALTGWIPFIGIGFAFGAFFFVFSMAINYKFMTAAINSESIHFFVKSCVLLLLTIVLMFTLNFILYKKNWTQDLTTNKINSLSNLTQALVKALPEDFYFYYFHVDNEKVKGFEAQVRAELQPYIALSSKVHYQSHSVFKRPDLAQKFKIGDEESALFAEYKGRIERVSGLDEVAITNVLLKLTKAPKKIYFLQNHDERKIEDASTFGLKGMAEQLGRLHYQTGVLENLDAMPDDIAMLVLAGPRLKIPDKELEQMDQYLKKGGSLFIAADPGEEHNLNLLLKKYNLELKNNFIYSEHAQASQSSLLVLTHAGNLQHEISKSLVPGQNPAFFISSSIEVLEGKVKGISSQAVLEHLPNSISRKDINPQSAAIVDKGKRVAAAVSEGIGENYFRIALVADSDFLTNQFYTRAGNFDFALSLFTFLSKDEDLLKMKTSVADTTSLVLTQTQMNLYFLFFVLPFAALFFILALFFKLRRFF